MRKIFSTLIILLCCTQLQAQVSLGYKSKGKSRKVNAATFSPDGNMLVFSSGNKVNIAKKGTATVHAVVKTSFSLIQGMTFIDETKLLVWGNERKLKVFRGGLDARGEVIDIVTHAVVNSYDFTEFIDQIEELVYINDTSFAIVSRGRLSFVNPSLKTNSTVNSLPLSITDIFYDDRTRILYTIHRDGSIQGVNPKNGNIESSLQVSKRPLLSGAISNNGKDIVVSNIAGKSYYLLRKDTGLVLTGSAKTNKGPVYVVTYSSDGQYFVTADNKRMFIFSSEYKRPVHKLNFKGAGTIQTVAFDPKGDFLAAGAFLKKKVRIFNTASLNIVPTYKHKNKNDQNPPQIMVTSPSSPKSTITVNSPTIQVKGLAVDDFGLNRLMINGVETKVSTTGDFSMEFPLAIGDNQLHIEATDVNDNVAVKKLTIKRESAGEMDLDFEVKNHLLIISIDQYAHWPALNNAVSDAERLKTVLAGKYDFDSENIITVTDTNANRNGILDGFKKLVENAGPNDNIIIYYSGHGYFDPLLGEGYWIPYDAPKGSEGDYFSNTFVLQLIKRIPSKHIFLLADACFSGSLFAEAHRGYTENVGQYKSRWGLASGRLEYVSDGSAGTQSPFNKHLLEYLENNEDSEFAVSQLVQYVKIKVANETDQTPIGNPLRNTGDEGGEFIFKKAE